MDVNLDQILHVAELFCIAGGAVVVAFKIGGFTKAIEISNVNFRREMEESKKDRAGIHDEIRRLAEAMTKDQIFDLRIANLETAHNKLEQWYDELRRNVGKIE